MMSCAGAVRARAFEAHGADPRELARRRAQLRTLIESWRACAGDHAPPADSAGIPARRGPCAFRQRDVTRAIKAARAAGVENAVVRLTDAHGVTIAIETASPSAANGSAPDGEIVL